MRGVTPFVLQRQRSRVGAALSVIVHLLVLSTLSMLPGYVALPALGGILLSAVCLLRQLGWLGARLAPLAVSADGCLWLDGQAVTLRPGAVVLPQLILLSLFTANPPRMQYWLALADSADTEALRQLRVCLRWPLPTQTLKVRS